MVFASGTIGVDPDTGSLVEGVAEQTRQALVNLSKVLEAGGSSLGKVLKTTVFMTNLHEFATMNEVYGGVFATDPPARSTIQVAALPRSAGEGAGPWAPDQIGHAESLAQGYANQCNPGYRSGLGADEWQGNAFW
jgi:2-iminobutanoate/2-iminopropanoate deaminase